MSVRGEFRRILGDAVEALRGSGAKGEWIADEIEPLGDLAPSDLCAAAEKTLAILGRLDAGELGRDASGGVLVEIVERLEAVCCVILGRS